MPEMVTEILWSVVNLLSIKSDAFALHLVQSGIVPVLAKLIDARLLTPEHKQHTLLALTALTNLSAD